MEHVEFTKTMKKTHKILVPYMLPIHFHFLQNILNKDGYKIELLMNQDQRVIDEGIKNVHNDTCYPATLVIGQMISALKYGNYDLQHVALAITQTGGGCRASNYIHLLRKALIQAGLPQIPVISVNFLSLEKQSGFKLTPKNIVRLLYGFLYGDMLMWIKNQCKPYEKNIGESDQLVNTWIDKITDQFDSLKFMNLSKNYKTMLNDFACLKLDVRPKIQVGIVGEIYMKYSPLGNNNLEDFLIAEGCEPILSPVLDFGLYCLENAILDHKYYNRNKYTYRLIKWVDAYIQHLQHIGYQAIIKQGKFRPFDTFKEVQTCSNGIINRGAKMGEGWLLTSEMVSLIKNNINNIVCCQPFGCLPNHIVAKGMMRKIKNHYPQANIVSVDYDSSATKVNQDNRLKLMLSNAQLNESIIKQEKNITPFVYAYESK
ncbi:MAG: 2-hydroxyacyl-CoA dehydratase [Erysipelotrichaceae bacterium]